MLIYSDLVKRIEDYPLYDVELQRGDELILFRGCVAATTYLHITRLDGYKVELGRGVDDTIKIQVTKEGAYPMRLYKTDVQLCHDTFKRFYLRLYNSHVFHDTLGYYVGYGVWRNETEPFADPRQLSINIPY